jgi:hypothetical protein
MTNRDMRGTLLIGVPFLFVKHFESVYKQTQRMTEKINHIPARRLLYTGALKMAGAGSRRKKNGMITLLSASGV